MKMAYLCSDKLKTIGMHSIHHEILRLALPSIISNITVPLLGLVDLTIVGHLGSEVYIGAIAVGTMIFNVLYWLLGFLRMGNSGMTSQAFGRRDEQAVRTILVRSLLIAIGMGVLFIVLQRPLCDVALWVMHPSAEIAAAAHTYFAICIWSAPAMLALYALNGWFVGLQTTKVPMFIALFQNVVNILLSLGFVIVMHMKIEGVAWGTMLAQWAGALLAMLLAYRKLCKQPLPQQPHKIALRWMDFFVVNRDIFLRTLFLVAVNLSFTSFGARSGDVVLSANTLLLTFFTLFSYVMDGFAFAGEALCGKSFGAANVQHFQTYVVQLMKWGLGMALLFSMVYFLGGRLLLRLLTNNESVLGMAAHFLGWVVLIPLAGFMAFVYDGVFIGATMTHHMLLSTLLSAAIFFVSYALLSSTMHNHALWLAFILFLLTRGVVLQGLLPRIKHKIIAS